MKPDLRGKMTYFVSGSGQILLQGGSRGRFYSAETTEDRQHAKGTWRHCFPGDFSLSQAGLISRTLSAMTFGYLIMVNMALLAIHVFRSLVTSAMGQHQKFSIGYAVGPIPFILTTFLDMCRSLANKHQQLCSESELLWVATARCFSLVDVMILGQLSTTMHGFSALISVHVEKGTLNGSGKELV
jgi:hypothetical protein